MTKRTPKEVIIGLFKDVLEAPSLDEKIVSDYVSPRYVQNVDGVTLDYADFIAHMRKQKSVLAALSVEFVAMVEENATVFTHHIVDAEKKDGSRLRVQVLAQFVIRDGKLLRCDELTRLLSGAEGDRDIGSRH